MSVGSDGLLVGDISRILAQQANDRSYVESSPRPHRTRRLTTHTTRVPKPLRSTHLDVRPA